MPWSCSPGIDYYALPSTESEEFYEKKWFPQFTTRPQAGNLTAIFLACLTSLAFGVTLGLYGSKVPLLWHSSTDLKGCQKFIIRHEWRALSHVEKLEYIDAVKCLNRQPSRMIANQTAYDDFAYVHSKYGGYCKFNSIAGLFYVRKIHYHLLIGCSS